MIAIAPHSYEARPARAGIWKMRTALPELALQAPVRKRKWLKFASAADAVSKKSNRLLILDGFFAFVGFISGLALIHALRGGNIAV